MLLLISGGKLDRGFKIITFGELRKMGVNELDPRPKVVFVNRRTAFKPPPRLLEQVEDLKRRKRNARKPNRIDPYMAGRYERVYRHMFVRNGEALKQLRELAMESKKRPVLMVKDKDRPDAEILVNIANTYMRKEAWK